jgi:hypothetical protein
VLSERNSAAAARPQRRLKGQTSQQQCGYVLQPLDLTLTFAQHRVACCMLYAVCCMLHVACCMLYVACWTYLGWFAQYDATVRIAHRLARFACELVGSTELLLKHSQDRPVQHATPNIAWARYSIVRTATVGALPSQSTSRAIVPAWARGSAPIHRTGAAPVWCDARVWRTTAVHRLCCDAKERTIGEIVQHCGDLG